MKNTAANFQPVTFRKEIDQILSDLQIKPVSIVCLSGEDKQFRFKVKQIQGDLLFVEFTEPPPRSLKAGEEIQLLFGLSEGYYSVKTKIATANEKIVSFRLGSEVFKLQRRQNFRTLVPESLKIGFKLQKLRGAALSNGEPLLTLIDVSAGGMKLVWPLLPDQEPPKASDELTGIMMLPESKQIPLTAVVRSANKGFKRDTLSLGMEFLGLSQRDEQSMLFFCVQIQRSKTVIR